jgi:hypothetical protein
VGGDRQLGGDRPRHPFGAESDDVEQTDQRVAQPREVQPGCRRMAGTGAGRRAAACIEDAEVSDDRVQAGALPGRGDHDTDVDPRPVGQHDPVGLEALHGGDRLHVSRPQLLHEPDVDDGDLIGRAVPGDQPLAGVGSP